MQIVKCVVFSLGLLFEIFMTSLLPIHHSYNRMEARMVVLKIIAIIAFVLLVMWTNRWQIEETEVDE